MFGYAGKFLEVNLTSETIKDTTFDETVLRQFIGGRGLGTKILWDRLGDRWETIDPLGPENILLFLAGPLTGYFPGGRTCVTGKSPQSNGIVGSTVAGEFPVELRCAGYDGIIVTGKARNPVSIYVKDGNAQIRDARHIWGNKRVDTMRTLTREIRSELEKQSPLYGEWKEPAMLYIGPAAENEVIPTAVLAKWTHGAGYGGYGAVMGSKNLKAVLANGTGPLPQAADMTKVRTLIDKISKACYANDSFRRWGTGAAGYTVGHDQSSEPVKNWQEEWHDEQSFGVDKFENKVWVKRYWGDFGCPTTCLKVAFVKTGPYKGAIGDNPDYELQAYLGTNLGIFTPEDNVYLTDVIEDLGFCGIQGGNILGFAGELYQRGILTSQDLGGLDLKWGDTKAFASLAQMIADRKGIGDVLAEGTYRAALKISDMKGVDVMPYAIHVKGIAIGAHGTRSGLDFSTPVAYVTNVQGGDHTSTSQLPIDSPFSELTVTLYDSGVFCWFNAMNSPIKVVLDFLEAVTGWRVTPFQWYNRLGRRIIHMQRVALLLGGPDAYWSPKMDDDIPPRFYEPLPTGPKAGQSTERSTVEEMKAEYYQKIGWGKRGIPRKAELRRLGLEDLSDALKRIKR